MPASSREVMPSCPVPALNLTGVSGRQWGDCRHPGKCEKSKHRLRSTIHTSPGNPATGEGRVNNPRNFPRRVLVPQGPGRVLSPGLSSPRRCSPLPGPPALTIASLFSLLGAPTHTPIPCPPPSTTPFLQEVGDKI